MKAVIMAGGEGTRLRPLTANMPKPLMPIANRPMMEHVIDLLKAHGITEIVVTLAFMPDAIRNHFGDGSEFGVEIAYAVEEQPLGTAGSVRNAAHLLDEPFLVISGDVLTDIDLTKVIEFHTQRDAMVTIALTPVEDPVDFGIVITRPDGAIERFLEKPTWGQVFSDTVNTGIFVLDPAVLDEIEPGEQVDFSGEVFPKLLAEGAPLYGAVAHGYWEDVGTLDSYLRAHRDVLDRSVNVTVPGFAVRDGVWLGEEAHVHPDADVVGPAVIGPNTRIEEGARIGPYTVLGRDVRVRMGADLERVVIGDHSYLGRGVQMRGTVGGRACDLRDGARTESGVVLGDECFIGAGALLNNGVSVYPSKIVEARAVVNNSIVWESHGARSLFGARGVTGLANVDLTPEVSARLAMAWASTMRPGDTVVASRDTSRTARMLKRAAVSGLNAAGVNVLDLEAQTVPVARFLARRPSIRGAITFGLLDGDPDSAQIQLFDAEGLDMGETQQRKLERVLQRQEFRRSMSSEVGDIDIASRAVERYALALGEIVDVKRIEAAHFKAVIDYSCGLTATVLPNVLSRFGADVLGVNPFVSTKGAIEHDFNGQARRVADLVRSSGADLGAVSDPTGERIVAIDDHGRILSHHELALAMLYLLGELGPYKAALRLNAPRAASEIVEDAGGSVVTTKLALSSLQEASLNDRASIGVGFDGGFIFPAFVPGYDGAATLAVVLELLARTGMRLSDAVDEIPDVHIAELTVPTAWQAKGAVMRRLVEDGVGQQVLLDGVKHLFDDRGWVLCVPDPEEPATNVWAEASSDREARALAEQWGRRVQQLAH